MFRKFKLFSFLRNGKLIERSYYLNKLQAVKDIPDIKVITGLRRSGKSKLLDAYANILERNYKQCNSNSMQIPTYPIIHSDLMRSSIQQDTITHSDINRSDSPYLVIVSM